MVEKRELGRIEFGPEGKHTASRMNPYDALPQAAQDLNRREHGLRVLDEDEVSEWAKRVGVDRGAAILALNVKMSQDFQGALNSEELEDLARVIQRYGDERAESAIERYQEQGE